MEGSNLVAAVYQDLNSNPGFIYVSTNSGRIWKSTSAPSNFWACVASSADGTKLVAVDSGRGDGLIYASTNSGKTWNPTSAPGNFWSSVASSMDGTKLASADSGYGDGLIYI